MIDEVFYLQTSQNSEKSRRIKRANLNRRNTILKKKRKTYSDFLFNLYDCIEPANNNSSISE